MAIKAYLIGQTSLLELAAICQGAQMYIGTESGPLQIAMAAGIPTVGIMGGGHPFRFYPYGDLEKHRVVYKRLDCYDCNWHCIYAEAWCIREIVPDKVSLEIESIMHSRVE